MAKSNPNSRNSRQASATSLSDMPAAAAEASALLKALANPKRLLVLCHLVEGELSVGELQARLEISQSALSQHLAKLREGGFVRTRREGQLVHYSLPKGPVRTLMGALHRIYCP